MKKFSIDVCTTGLFVSKDYPTVCTDAIEIDGVSGIRTLAASVSSEIVPDDNSYCPTP